jgi:hypothetical protein
MAKKRNNFFLEETGHTYYSNGILSVGQMAIFRKKQSNANISKKITFGQMIYLFLFLYFFICYEAHNLSVSYLHNWTSTYFQFELYKN